MWLLQRQWMLVMVPANWDAVTGIRVDAAGRCAHVHAEPRSMKTAPGMRWVMVLGIAGFAAGFFGPLIFVPEANQGPLVGILISGPAGAVAGLLLYGLCALFRVSANTQWRLLYGTAAAGVLVTLLAVQPGPALLGRIYDTQVQSCSAPITLESQALRAWEQRVAEVTWAQPRSDWREQMRRELRNAPGIVVTLKILRENSVYEHRKPWNRGKLYAAGWQSVAADKTIYIADGWCGDFPAGRAERRWDAYDLGGRIKPPDEWPPTDIESVIRASTLSPVPDKFAMF
jgi:hypothetical protein